MIVGLLGKKQSGKDTSARLLIEKLGFKRVAFADALKDLTAKILDGDSIVRSEAFKNTTTYLETTWGPDQQLTGREWLQRIGVAVRDVLGKDAWLNVVRAKMGADPSAHWVVTDVRFKNEYEMLFGCGPTPRRFIRCARSSRLLTPVAVTDGDQIQGLVDMTRSSVDTHVSETELDNAWVDRTITTNSADTTAQAVLTAVESWLSESRTPCIECNGRGRIDSGLESNRCNGCAGRGWSAR